MRVKICGLTDLDSALTCINEGVHALGFIFVPSSPRYLTLEKALSLINKLPPLVERVGVFADQELAEIINICKNCHLSAIQIHGKTEDKLYLESLKKQINLPIIRAFRLNQEINTNIILKSISESQDLLNGLLIDSSGSGSIICLDDFKTIKQNTKLPLILAGALNEDNLENIIYKLKEMQALPYAIDLCSSLESERGEKDIQKIKSFMRKFEELKRA